MIYIDTSALAKRYITEAGSAQVRTRLAEAAENGERTFTSVLTYAESLTLFGRRYQAGEFDLPEFRKASDDFLADWHSALNILELDTRTMSALPELTARYPLKSADAVHLSAALWLQDGSHLAAEFAGRGALLEFVVADKSLARIASDCGMAVFDPQPA